MVSIEEVRKPGIPLIVVYNRRIDKSNLIHTLESNLKVRDQFSLKDMIPLPNYFAQMMIHLGQIPQKPLLDFLCSHFKFPPGYSDIYPENINEIIGSKTGKMGGVSLLEVERNGEPLRHNNVKINPEIQMISNACLSAQRMLLGSSMLPKPVAEYFLEKV